MNEKLCAVHIAAKDLDKVQKMLELMKVKYLSELSDKSKEDLEFGIDKYI